MVNKLKGGGGGEGLRGRAFKKKRTLFLRFHLCSECICGPLLMDRSLNLKFVSSFVPHARICDEQPSGNKTMILTHIYILRLFLSRVFNPTIASTVLRVAAAKSQNTYLTLRKKADPDPPPAAWSSVVRIRSEIDGIRIRHLQISGSESKLRN